MTEVCVVVLILLAVLVRLAEKALFKLPAKELRRRAAKNDENSHKLYQAARYEGSLRLFLEVMIAVFVAGAASILAALLSSFWVTIVVAAFILSLFVILPVRPSGSFGKRVAVLIAPGLAWLMNYISPLLRLFAPRNFGQARTLKFYDHHEFIDFLKQQKNVEGSQIEGSEIDKSIKSLTHKDRHVSDIMVPKKSMHIIEETDAVGPILLSELHESRQDCFAVRNKKKDIIGTIELGKLLELKEGGKVSDAMNHELTYVNQDWLVEEAAVAPATLKQNVFLVIDKNKKITGIVSFAKILEELIGKDIYKNKRDYFSIENVADANSRQTT